MKMPIFNAIFTYAWHFP